MTAHFHFHLSTTCLPSHDLARHALLFLSCFSLSLFLQFLPYFVIDLAVTLQVFPFISDGRTTIGLVLVVRAFVNIVFFCIMVRKITST